MTKLDRAISDSEIRRSKIKNSEKGVFWFSNLTMILLTLSFVFSENSVIENMTNMIVPTLFSILLLVFASFVIEQSFKNPFSFFFMLYRDYLKGAKHTFSLSRE
jgi:protein-S-isoprenylcysteine O-methyltransferase Ste14